MMLHFMRKRQRELAEAEARGESFWTPAFEPECRVRILRATREVADQGYPPRFELVLSSARERLLNQLGRWNLTGDGKALPDMTAYVASKAPDEMMPSAIEAIYGALESFDETDRQQGFWTSRTLAFVQIVNAVLLQHRVAWRLDDGQMVELASMELHQSVVEPVLRLLHRSELSAVDAAYRRALEELSSGDPADAITDAGTALQEALQALGCDGKNLTALMASARRRGLLAAHDAPLQRVIEGAIEWVGADRSQLGDSHRVTSPAAADAWFTVHIVGALIVRLVDGSPRGTT